MYIQQAIYTSTLSLCMGMTLIQDIALLSAVVYIVLIMLLNMGYLCCHRWLKMARASTSLPIIMHTVVKSSYMIHVAAQGSPGFST